MNRFITRFLIAPATMAVFALVCGAALADGPSAEGTAPAGVFVSNFNGLSCPEGRPIGLLGHAQSVGNRAIGIDVQGDYAYVGDWHQGPYHRYAGVLQAFDVSDPCHPLLKGSVETTYPGYNEIGDVAVHGSHVYVANDGNGLGVYDIGTDPANPNFLYQVSGGRPGYDHWVFYEGGDHLYVGGWSYFVQAFDLPPAPPVTPGDGITRIPDNFGVADMFVTDNRAYLFTDPRLYIVDADDLHSQPPYGVLPVIASVDMTGYGSGGEVKAQGGYAYLAMGESGTSLGGLRIVDVNETAPAIVSTFDLAGGAGNIFAKGIGVAVSGERAFVAARGGLWVFDTSHPEETPIPVYKFPLPFASATGARVEVRENLAYLTAHNDAGPGGLAIYKLPDPVAIDVQPGTEPNCVNLNGKGVIPVAIFGNPEIDVNDIDRDSLTFAGMDVATRGKKGPLCSVKDMNADPYPDLVCHFEDQPLNWVSEYGAATLNGQTFGGDYIGGADWVCTVP